MAIEINTVKPQIQINTTNAKLNIKHSTGELNIKTTDAEMNMDRKLPRVKIDQYQCFAEAGLKNNTDLSKAFVQLAYQKSLEGIGSRVSEGNTLMNIQNGSGDMIAQMAKNVKWGTVKDFNFTMIPKSRPKITVEGHMNVNWKEGETNINYTPVKPDIQYQPGKVEAYLNQKPSIDMRYVDERK